MAVERSLTGGRWCDVEQYGGARFPCCSLTLRLKDGRTAPSVLLPPQSVILLLPSVLQTKTQPQEDCVIMFYQYRAIYWPLPLNVHYICQCSAVPIENVDCVLVMLFYCCCIIGVYLKWYESKFDSRLVCLLQTDGCKNKMGVYILCKLFPACLLKPSCVSDDDCWALCDCNIMHCHVTKTFCLFFLRCTVCFSWMFTWISPNGDQ